jgi:hypothetical protein
MGRHIDETFHSVSLLRHHPDGAYPRRRAGQVGKSEWFQHDGRHTVMYSLQYRSLSGSVDCLIIITDNDSMMIIARWSRTARVTVRLLCQTLYFIDNKVQSVFTTLTMKTVQ